MATAYGQAEKGTGSEFKTPVLEDDTYNAVVKDIQDAEGTEYGKPDVTIQQYRVHFEIPDDDLRDEDGDLPELVWFVRIPQQLIDDGILNDGSNLYKFARACGEDDEHPNIAPDDWIGSEVRITVKNKEVQSGEHKGEIRPRVTDVMAIRKGRGQSSTEAKPKAATRNGRASRGEPPRRSRGARQEEDAAEGGDEGEPSWADDED